MGGREKRVAIFRADRKLAGRAPLVEKRTVEKKREFNENKLRQKPEKHYNEIIMSSTSAGTVKRAKRKQYVRGITFSRYYARGWKNGRFPVQYWEKCKSRKIRKVCARFKIFFRLIFICAFNFSQWKRVWNIISVPFFWKGYVIFFIGKLNFFYI